MDGDVKIYQIIMNWASEVQSEMTEEELADLTYAFQAADMDSGGAIDSEEFALMLEVMGANITMDQVREVIGDAKDGFATWKKMADKENIEKCKRIWDEYDEDGSGTMDLKEVNGVIQKLQSMGFNPEPMSAADMVSAIWRSHPAFHGRIVRLIASDTCLRQCCCMHRPMANSTSTSSQPGF